jgi:hypothetical protein
MIVKDYDAYIERNLKRGYTKDQVCRVFDTRSFSCVLARRLLDVLSRVFLNSQLGVGRTWEMRSVMHDKEKKLKKALFDTKTEWKELTGASSDLTHQRLSFAHIALWPAETARAFVREFQPRKDKTGQYVKRLRESLPQHGEGCVRAFCVTSALVSDLCYVLSVTVAASCTTRGG